MTPPILPCPVGLAGIPAAGMLLCPARTAGVEGAWTPMSLFKNERNTENVVRAELRKLGYYKKPIVVEEQKSEIEAVRRLMKAASKSGHGGIGAPEFIISSSANPDFLVIIECKADPRVIPPAGPRTALRPTPNRGRAYPACRKPT